MSLAASDQIAIKNSTTPKTATVTATRTDGDWTLPLTVNLSRNGASTAFGGTDYSMFNCCSYITIPAGQASEDLAVNPVNPGGSTYEKTLILTLEPNALYSVGQPDFATVFIYDPGAPMPPPVQAPSGLVSFWRAENDVTDTVGGNNGTPSTAPNYLPGKCGQAFSFNGVDQVLSVPSSGTLNQTAAITIEGWAIAPSWSGNDGVALVGKDNPYGPRHILSGLATLGTGAAKTSGSFGRTFGL